MTGDAIKAGRSWSAVAWPRAVREALASLAVSLPRRAAVFWTVFALGAAGLALQVLSKEVTDAKSVHARLVTAIESGEVFDPASPISGNLHFSECMSASILLHEGSGAGLHATLAMDSIRWDGTTVLCASLLAAVRDPAAVFWHSYGRYWHGNLVLERLWLDRWSYDSLSSACHALALTMLALFGLALAWRFSALTGLATAGLGYLLSDIASATFLPSQGISLATLFGGAAIFTMIAPGRPARALTLAAFAVGAGYNYFDFLYNPGLMAGLLGWVAVLAAPPGDRARQTAWRAVAVTLMALGGFFAMWAAKWALCCVYMVSTFDFFAILSPSNATHWMAGGEIGLWPFEATWQVLQSAFETWWHGPLAAVAIGAALAFAKRRAVLNRLWLPALPLTITLLTLELASGHTVSHGFTWRAIPFLLAAFCGSAIALAEKATRRQMAAMSGATGPSAAVALAAGD